MNDIDIDNIRLEFTAELCHNQWSNWMIYLFNNCIKNSDGSVTIPKKLVDRWTRQLETAYVDLSEPEKQSDRNEAIKFIKLLL